MKGLQTHEQIFHLNYDCLNYAKFLLAVRISFLMLQKVVVRPELILQRLQKKCQEVKEPEFR